MIIICFLVGFGIDFNQFSVDAAKGLGGVFWFVVFGL
jgi:hypothetical protein